MAAAKKKLTHWNSQDIGAVPAKSKMLKLFIPVREARCEFIKGETPEEAGVSLAVRLREAKLL
jgi:electron transfer flavoprotein alpha/beta subunit